MAAICSRCVLAVQKIQIFPTLGLRLFSGTTSRQCQQPAAGETASEEKAYEVRERILEAALKYVHEHGWSKNALAAGAEEVGFPGIAHGMFSDGGVELVHHFYRSKNMELSKHLAEELLATQDNPEWKKSTRKFVRDALETRLRMVIPFLDVWPQAMGLMALPQNAPTALQNLVNLTDEVWYHAGDRSTDFNWYSKRASLAFVYKSSELSMLQDKSEDFENTLFFLDRRLQDVLVAGRVFSKVEQSSDILWNAFTTASILARNMAGANDRNR